MVLKFFFKAKPCPMRNASERRTIWLKNCFDPAMKELKIIEQLGPLFNGIEAVIFGVRLVKKNAMTG
jgi:hypothetical protein